MATYGPICNVLLLQGRMAAETMTSFKETAMKHFTCNITVSDYQLDYKIRVKPKLRYNYIRL